MKVLDPQSALLTTAEVHEFFQTNPSRQADKKIGAYAPANLHNYRAVRKDVETYIGTVQPQIVSYRPSEEFMPELLQRLKPFDLTKVEVYTLINLGVGVSQPAPTLVVEAQTNGDATRTETAAETGETAAEPTDSDLGLSLFRLVIEESDERFQGERGERRIQEILQIMSETICDPAISHNGR